MNPRNPKPFSVEHVREYADGTCTLRAVNIKPGLMPSDLIEWVLTTRKADVGAIYTADKKPAQRAEYERGHLTNTFIIPEREIKALEIYGGYHRWDYIISYE